MSTMSSTFEDVPMSDDMDFEEDVEAELEVDELDPSDDDQQPAAARPAKPKSRKSSTSKPGVRVPGHTLLPTTRVENLLQANGITSTALGMSKEGQFMLSIATEEIIKLLAKHAYEQAQREKSNLVRYEDIAQVPVGHQPEFAFLQEIIPRPMALKYAIDFREQRLQELQDQDPSVGGYTPDSVSTALAPEYDNGSTSASANASTKSKKHKPSTNGKDRQANGSNESASGKQRKSDKSASAKSSRSASTSSAGAEELPMVKLPPRPTRKSLNGLITASHLAARPTYPSPLANGHVKSESPEPDAMDETSAGDNPPWTNPPISPAGGFYSGPSPSFDSRSESTNPGRTIYS